MLSRGQRWFHSRFPWFSKGLGMLMIAAAVVTLAKSAWIMTQWPTVRARIIETVDHCYVAERFKSGRGHVSYGDRLRLECDQVQRFIASQSSRNWVPFRYQELRLSIRYSPPFEMSLETMVDDPRRYVGEWLTLSHPPSDRRKLTLAERGQEEWYKGLGMAAAGAILLGFGVLARRLRQPGR